MAKALCLECGASKEAPVETCDQCGWSPFGDPEDTARSLYLSTARFDTSAGDALEYEHELDRIGAQIAGGQEFDFAAVDLRPLRKRAVQEFPPPRFPKRMFIVLNLLVWGFLALIVWFVVSLFGSR
jgi:hypothetical protein